VTRVAGVVLFVVAGGLLLTMGGAILAAPVTLPLMYVLVRAHATRPFCVGGAVIGALTAGECAWLCVYVVAGEPQPWVWLVPLFAAVGTAVTFSARRWAPWRSRARCW
jgi:hypothetical protein